MIMPKDTPMNSTKRPRYVIPAAALVFLIGCVTATRPARAFVSVVTNPTALIQSATQFSEKLAQWQKTIEQYQKTAQHYVKQAQFWESQINTLRNLRFAIFATKNEFTKVEEDFGVDVECPGRDTSRGISGVLDKALDSMVPSVEGNVLQQQQDLCAQIVRAKNQKYNATVTYLDFVKLKTDELLLVQKSVITKIGSSTGKTQGAIQQLTELSETIDLARTGWESNQKQADAYINMLLTMQATLSRRALKGKPSVLGSVVNTVALKAALGK